MADNDDFETKGRPGLARRIQRWEVVSLAILVLIVVWALVGR